MAKLPITLTGARGSKLAFLGFADITCSLGRFTFPKEFAVIEGMVSDMLLGIRWEHKFNIHTSWTRRGNHYISIGKNNFVAESTNKLNVHPIIKMKGKVTLKPESSYPPSSSMEMETLMKRPEGTLEDMKNADKWKTKVINMLESKFASIILKFHQQMLVVQNCTL